MCRSKIFIFYIISMQKIILIFILIILGSCTLSKESMGRLNEINVIISPEDKNLITPIIDNLFSQTIYTPQSENIFVVKYRNPWEINNYEGYGNLILASIDFPEDSTGDILMQRFLARYGYDKKLLTLGDLYAKNQIFCVMHALDSIEFENLVNTNRKWILQEFNELFEQRMMIEIFKNGKNISR